jgi:hypothetical protein
MVPAVYRKISLSMMDFMAYQTTFYEVINRVEWCQIKSLYPYVAVNILMKLMESVQITGFQ